MKRVMIIFDKIKLLKVSNNSNNTRLIFSIDIDEMLILLENNKIIPLSKISLICRNK